MEQKVYLIRHGSTHKHETGELLRDDPLGVRGRADAEALVSELAALDIGLILVSPLQRTLETAVLAFSTRPSIRFFVEPLLREFNMMQLEKNPIFARHQGSPIRVLKEKFSNAHNASTYRANIEWPAGVGEDDEWWEPHGDFARSHFSTCTTAFERAQLAARNIWLMACSVAPQSVAVVAHENLFRSMVGCLSMPTTAQVPAYFSPSFVRVDHGPAIVVTAASTRRFFVDGILPSAAAATALAFHHADTHSGAHPLAPTESSLVACAGSSNRGAHKTRHALVVLGCADPAVAEMRLHFALQQLSAMPAVLLVACSPNELQHAVSFMEKYFAELSPRDLKDIVTRIILDANSTNTIDNALFSLQRLQLAAGHQDPKDTTPMHLRLITNDWHMPRSLVIFFQKSRDLGMNWVLTTPCSAATPACALASAKTKHLLDAMYHMAYFAGSGDTDALRLRVALAAGLGDLLAVGRNYRRWASTHYVASSAATALVQEACARLVDTLRAVELDGAPARQHAAREYVFELCREASFPPGMQGNEDGSPRHVFPLALLPLNSQGSNSLHFAASKGMNELCLDLMCFFGCHAGQPNLVGKTAADFARPRFPDLADLLQDAAGRQREQDES